MSLSETAWGSATRLFTSNFELTRDRGHVLGIAREPPEWFTGRNHLALAPSLALLREYFDRAMTWPDYIERFHREVLSPLDPSEVVADLGDGTVLLCWCRPGRNCHRRIVANWIERETGLTVPEL